MSDFIPDEATITHGSKHLGDNIWQGLTEAEVARGIRAIKAAAWDEGYTSGHSRAMRRMSDEPNVEPGVNPYREGQDDG